MYNSLQDRDNDILIQEPYVAQNRPSLIAKEGYTLVHVEDFNRTVRATILVRNSLQAWRVDRLCSVDTEVVSVVVNNKTVYIASVYCDKDYKLRVVLGKLLKYCNEHRVPLLIGMDSNAHSGIWGCDENNSRGDEVEDLLDEHELAVSNVGNTPTIRQTKDDQIIESIIDITVTNKFAADINVENWQVLDEETDSDHKYISYSFGEYQPIQNFYRNYKRAPWMLFKSYCEIASRDIFGMTDELELNWEDPTLYIDGKKGRNLYKKKDKLFRKLQNIISETKSKYSDAHLDM